MSKTKNTVKTGISIDSNLLARCDASIPLTNAQSRSEFISDALEYYIASLNAKGSSKVLTPALKSVVGSKITLSEDIINKMLKCIKEYVIFTADFTIGGMIWQREERKWP